VPGRPAAKALGGGFFFAFSTVLNVKSSPTSANAVLANYNYNVDIGR
jgi:hypothetical protein